MKIFLIYLLLINAVSFAAMGIDKKRAVKNKWRIPEKTLFLFVLLGGGIGGTAGMYFFRHKTKHWYFAVGFPFIAAVEYAFIFYFFVIK
ncbi:MAG: DUF1294 domain-containing protein [Ruminococcus sp.]